MKQRFRVAYPAVITAQEDGSFLVEFPDLEGCLTEGDTMAEARAMAREALTGWLESEMARGADIPDAGPSGSGTALIEPEPHVAVPLMLRRARAEAGLTQAEMARRMGIACTSYQHLEYPRNFNATIKNLERAGKALGLNVKLELV